MSSQAASSHSAFISSLIETAEAKVKKSPAVAEGYSDLAFALARRARETQDPSDWKRAEQAIESALKVDPRNFEARRARVMVRIQQGRFADANEEAVALNRQTPDDNPMYGLLADIALARGEYAAAESLAQRMLDLRQVNGPGLERAAAVREAIGFPDGAAEFWNSALRLTSAGDTEERAHILTQLAGLSRRQGKLDDATRFASGALAIDPGYPAALIEQARITLDLGKAGEALPVLEKRLGQNGSIAAMYWKFQALKALGSVSDANAAGERFLQAAQQAAGKPGNCDDLLMRYLTGQRKAAEAVTIGADAVAKTPNLEMLDAFAMSLLAAGHPQEASEQIDRLLHWGVRDPRFFFHAAEISESNSNRQRAADFLRRCIEVNGSSRYAVLAMEKLQSAPAKTSR